MMTMGHPAKSFLPVSRERERTTAHFLLAFFRTLCYAYVERSRREVFLVKVQRVAGMALSHVCNVDALQGMGFVPLQGEEVERVLDVLHRVDMPVDVDVVVVHVERPDQSCAVPHLHP